MKIFKENIFLFVMLLILSLPIVTYAMPLSENTSELQNMVNNTIRDYSQNFEESSWNSSSKVNNVIPLYDLDNNLNGYIFEINTDGKDTGFIQIDISTGNNIISSFGFNGKHVLNYMISKYKKSLGNTSQKINKVIYLGNYDYLIKDDTILFDLNTGENIPESIVRLKIKYNDLLKLKKIYGTNKVTPYLNSAISTVKKYIPNANNIIFIEMCKFIKKPY